jgi:hypothetical protein
LVDILACSRPVPYDGVFTPWFPEVESILADEREHFRNLEMSIATLEEQPLGSPDLGLSNCEISAR